MELHQLRYFAKVAELGHFTRAAEECNVTQPALTRAIKQLEDEFGGDVVAGARPVLHRERLAPFGLQVVGHQPRHEAAAEQLHHIGTHQAEQTRNQQQEKQRS